MVTKKTSKSTASLYEKNKDAIVKTPHYCSLVELPERVFAPSVSMHRIEMIQLVMKKWINGTTLKYYFFNGSSDGSPSSWKGTATQIASVKKGFDTWKQEGIGLIFEETNDRNEAEIRIGFLRGDGAWSYLGRDVIDQVPSPAERTMNFGWDISTDVDTTVHEIGHTLGSPHEHQNPLAGIVWNEEAVYTALAQPPNRWSRAKTFHNIIRKLPFGEVEGSTHDPNSIMHYPFGPGLIVSPTEFRNGITPAGGLSAKDKEFIKKFYPPIAAADYIRVELNQSKPINIKPSQQKNFTFKPTRSRKYTIETFGTMDMVMVLFEKTPTGELYLSGDDDSGKDYNAKINMRLIKGREYIIRVRLFYAGQEGTGSLMVY